MDLSEPSRDSGFNVRARRCCESICGKTVIREIWFCKTKITKKNALNEPEHRNEQFVKINELRKMAESSGCPILSLDTKQKELLGEV